MDETKAKEQKEKEIANLIEEAKYAQKASERRAIFDRLEELKGEGRETRVTDGNTRFIRTRYYES